MDENPKNELNSGKKSSSKNKTNNNNQEKEKDIKIGNYIIKKTLGKGTFAKVKLAIQLPKKKKVAIKIIEKRILQEEDDIIRLKREFEMLTKFNNPNIISVTEIFESDSAYFTVMEFCEGGELFNYIVENKVLSEEKAAFFYYQLINGLEYIHSLGIVHRDLKPENLLLTSEHILKIIDFGLSNYYTKNNKQLLETPCGSPCYASPEMLSGEGYDGFKIDIWATGIILFAMLCGYLPFDHKDNNKLFKKILECKINYPKNLSSDSKDLIKKILVPNPRRRISIPEIKEHPFYLKGKEIFENNFSILQISRESSNSSLMTSEEIYFDITNSDNKYLWYENNHKSQNLFINFPDFSLKNFCYIKNNKSRSFEKLIMFESAVKKILNKIKKNKKKGKHEFMKQIQKERLYLKNCLDKNNGLLTFNYSAINTLQKIDQLCEKIINQYKKEQRSKIKNKFEKNKLLKNNFHKIANQKFNENNTKTNIKNKHIFLSNDYNIFNDTNNENEKIITKSNNIDKQIKTEVLQTQKKNDNLNGLLRQKIHYLNKKQNNKINLINQNIKVNIRKTTPNNFVFNKLLFKQKKLIKINKLPKNIKEKIEQKQKIEKVSNPKIQKIKNMLNIIEQQSNKPNINIINKQNIIHHHTTNITNLTKTNYYSNIIINNPKHSNEDKEKSFSPNAAHVSNNILNKPSEKKQAKDYLKKINTISFEDIKRTKLKSNLNKKIVSDNNTIKIINNNKQLKNINKYDIRTQRIPDNDKINDKVNIREKSPLNQLNNIRIKVYQNAKNLSKFNKNNIKLNLASNIINNNNNKNKFLKLKENISLEYSLGNTKNLDFTNNDKTNNNLKEYINMNNSLDNPKSDYYRKNNFEKIVKKKLNLNLDHLDKFSKNKNNYYLDNNIFNYTDRNIICNSHSKKLKNLKKNNLFKKQNNIQRPKLNLKELLTLPNQQKKGNFTSINYFHQQCPTQRDKSPQLTNSKNNKNIYKYAFNYHSKDDILQSSDKNNLWNMTSNQIFTNYLNKMNLNFLRNKKCFLNTNRNKNYNHLNKFKMNSDYIKFNKNKPNLKKSLNTIQNPNKIHETYFKIIDDNDKKTSTINANYNRGIETTRIKRKKINLNPNIINDDAQNLNKVKINTKFNLLKNKKDLFRNNKILFNNKTIEIKTDNNNKFYNPNILIDMKKNNEKNKKNVNNESTNFQDITNKSNIINLKNYKYNIFNTEINSNNSEINNANNFSQTVRNNKILKPNTNNYTKTKKVYK